MQDFARARRTMVDNQLRTSAITNWRILDVMNRVPREIFVPEARRELSYIDDAIALSETRSMLAPAEFARLIQLAEIGGDDVILDVGCGTGYSCAVLAGLGNAVVGLESDEALVATANDTLASLDIGNAAVVAGPLDQGVAKEAPFDVIIVEGAVEIVPQTLFDQLRDGGRLVAVVGQGNAAIAHLYVRHGDEIFSRTAFNASLPAIAGFSRPAEFQF
ncbi:protein-L-isoaspartate O-methyltransferase family protein [Pelagibacterium lentulum]|uniref:Protein-L-isoaspartate O-methyltransferase n=1 Tax=Pelagibacterium lentulum TaxID=2029865 RepID=A0A916RE85_9HYPH|nr:protein-L-isoaspartate O-methyltransferase [Pelagibacterium lentulum]GGA53410.1 protein-L-isoaspartate O-methyltransferase [Pelagibacterium lentulum]